MHWWMAAAGKTVEVIQSASVIVEVDDKYNLWSTEETEAPRSNLSLTHPLSDKARVFQHLFTSHGGGSIMSNW